MTKPTTSVVTSDDITSVALVKVLLSCWVGRERQPHYQYYMEKRGLIVNKMRREPKKIKLFIDRLQVIEDDNMPDEIYLTPEEDRLLDKNCDDAFAYARENMIARHKAKKETERAAKEAQESSAKSDKK